MADARTLPVLPGRGAAGNPGNRFARLTVSPVEADGGAEGGASHDPGASPSPLTRFYEDHPRSIVARNESPDVGFDAGVNPYRGCEHGCAYCFARPSHEYLGFSAGLDFETRIMVKRDAPSLLRETLADPRWRPRPLMLSGNTDPYQAVERRLGITRGCLEVLAEARHPVGIITKSHGVVRDIDLLSELARHRAVAVTLSVTSLRRKLQRVLEPRASTPRQRLGALRTLADAGIPVGVNLAPVVPGLTDEEMASILEAAADAGATWAGYILLRLPHGVKGLFVDWLEAHVPERRERVLHRLRDAYGGALYDPAFHVRGKGRGPYAEQLRQLFRVTSRRLGLGKMPVLSAAAFRRPARGSQLGLGL
jgi:DNA repair photolyase